MEPISPADRLVLILRKKLQERAKAAASGRSTPKPDVGAPAHATGKLALPAIGNADESVFRRTLIQSLLADQLGRDLVNDVQFQQTVSRVTEAIEEDAIASQLLARVVAELRSA